MKNLEQVVEKEEKSVFKIFLVIIGFIILINFAIFIMDIYTEAIPYLSTMATIALVVASCTFILIKYFSKYLYAFEEGHLVFYRLIGKRKFHMLTIDNKDLIYVKPYEEKEEKEKYPYKLIFSKNKAEVYIGEFKGEDRERVKFLFSPNESILKEIKTILKK